MNFNDLSKFTFVDMDKKAFLDEILYIREEEALKTYELHALKLEVSSADKCDIAVPTKFCPQCHRKYPEEENFCLKCGVVLKDIRNVNVNDVEIKPEFIVEGANDYTNFNDILTDENLEKITNNSFDIDNISKNIRLTAIRRLDSTIKDNDILLDDLSILEKVILFTKSFVEVEYKSYGQELGYYEFNKIHVDDRQLDALQITTLLHELTHFLNKEILSHILCQLLDCTKTKEVESIITFVLSYSPLNQLIDEYAAHTVEGRFTLYGFQDYSSYLNIQKSIDMSGEEIEMLKTIGNTLANIIKDMLESFIDEDLFEDIKSQFRDDIMDSPDYKNLALENCTLLNDEGLTRAIKFILHDGFAIAMDNIQTLEQYNINWND